jgi:hypothetical protein
MEGNVDFKPASQSQSSNQFYHRYREELIASNRISSEQFDKAILTLSAGGLGLSVGFVKDIAPVEQVLFLSILICSWALFCASILITLTSFVLSQISVERQLEYAKEYYLNDKPEFQNKVNPYTRATRLTNIISGIFFVSAAVLTVWFASANITHIKETKKMDTSGNRSEVSANKGIIQPTAPNHVDSDSIRGIIISPMPPIPNEPPSSGGTGKPISSGGPPHKP